MLHLEKEYSRGKKLEVRRIAPWTNSFGTSYRSLDYAQALAGLVIRMKKRTLILEYLDHPSWNTMVGRIPRMS